MCDKPISHLKLALEIFADTGFLHLQLDSMNQHIQIKFLDSLACSLGA